MIVIIGGSRTIIDAREVTKAVLDARKAWGVTKFDLVLSGQAAGPDTIGASIAKELGYPVEFHPARWNGIDPATGRPYGKRAGFVRNQEMVNKADAVIAIWDGKSRGTQHLINLANQKGIKCWVHIVGEQAQQPVNPTQLQMTAPQL